MSFIAKHIIASDERLIGVARPHWIYLVTGVFWALIILAITAGLQAMMTYFGMATGFTQSVNVMGYTFVMSSLWLTFILDALAIILFMVYAAMYISIEVGLTTHRVIRKSGLISIEVQTIEINEIEAANIHHGLFGAILNYGSLLLDCRFVGDVRLPAIRRPYQFLKALHKVQEQQKAPPPPPLQEDQRHQEKAHA